MDGIPLSRLAQRLPVHTLQETFQDSLRRAVTKSMACWTVVIFSASSSGISVSNSSSRAITSSTVSKESAPRSSTKDASFVTSSSFTPNCSATMLLTCSSILLIVIASPQEVTSQKSGSAEPGYSGAVFFKSLVNRSDGATSLSCRDAPPGMYVLDIASPQSRRGTVLYVKPLWQATIPATTGFRACFRSPATFRSGSGTLPHEA